MALSPSCDIHEECSRDTYLRTRKCGRCAQDNCTVGFGSLTTSFPVLAGTESTLAPRERDRRRRRRLSVCRDNRTDRIVASSRYSELAAVVLFLEIELSHLGSEVPNCLNTKKVDRRTKSRATSVFSLSQHVGAMRTDRANLIIKARDFRRGWLFADRRGIANPANGCHMCLRLSKLARRARRRRRRSPILTD